MDTLRCAPQHAQREARAKGGGGDQRGDAERRRPATRRFRVVERFLCEGERADDACAIAKKGGRDEGVDAVLRRDLRQLDVAVELRLHRRADLGEEQRALHDAARQHDPLRRREQHNVGAPALCRARQRIRISEGRSGLCTRDRIPRPRPRPRLHCANVVRRRVPRVVGVVELGEAGGGGEAGALGERERAAHVLRARAAEAVLRVRALEGEVDGAARCRDVAALGVHEAVNGRAVDDEADADARADCDVAARRRRRRPRLRRLRLHAHKLGHRWRVDVGVKRERHVGPDGAEGAEDVGVLPAGLGRRRDEAVRRAARLQVHRPEGRDAERVVLSVAQPRGAVAEGLGGRGRRELGAVDDVARRVVRDGHHPR
eukprot:5419274-Prymnesium_polylepis.1